MAWRAIFRELMRKKRELEELAKKVTPPSVPITISKSDTFDVKNLIITRTSDIFKLTGFGTLHSIFLLSNTDQYRLKVILDNREVWDKTWQEFYSITSLPQISAYYDSELGGYQLTIYNQGFSESAIIRVIPLISSVQFYKVVIPYTITLVRKLV